MKRPGVFLSVAAVCAGAATLAHAGPSLDRIRSSRPEPTRLKVVGKFLTVEPLAIMLTKNDPESKRIVDAEMKRLIASREAYSIYDKWFLRSIPPRNVALELPMNYLLKNFWKYPSDWVPN